MSEKKAAAERSFPRQVKMTDEFHAVATARARALGKDFSKYVRGLIDADLSTAKRKAVR